MWYETGRATQGCYGIEMFPEICSTTGLDKLMNDKVSQRLVRGNMSDRVDWKVSKWLRHVECLSEEQLT